MVGAYFMHKGQSLYRGCPFFIDKITERSGSMDKLTAKQKRFCEEYLKDLNATQAAIRAGYSEKTAEQAASRMLRIVKVQEYLQQFQNKIDQKNIKSVEEVQEWWSEVMADEEAKLTDRIKASELLVKSKGGFMDRVQVNGNIRNPLAGLTTEELKKLVDDA